MIHTSGNQYWARSMSIGYDYISNHYPVFDFLFVFNDDVIFNTNAIKTMLLTHFSYMNSYNKNSVIVGATIDPLTSSINYGGLLSYPFGFYPVGFRKAPLRSYIQTVNSLNMNAALIPFSVLEKTTFLQSYFIHGNADWEYGIQCSKLGIPIVQCPGYVGKCSPNFNPFDVSTLKLTQFAHIFLEIFSLKRLPIGVRLRYCFKNGGFFWFIWFFVPYITWFFYLLRKL